ncbi:hypothetical protein K466DRAFT_566274 [Polyporus arcularius HHB13444]|uniref:HMG box domain-containing protein n=1 Tax=Polyporus arcularius HHB13444 TaxID=1314778 RepID=A0A5C3PJ70_9APHY|nr:hypothetical protein K466DRAFT_566274 [Polyporus arcularius HHB13444]
MPFDDDDGMPPLVDAPLPPMTFTFTTQLPPISYSIGGPYGEVPAEEPVPDAAMDSPPGTPMLAPTRTSHSKKRDASYIPRPPNAFILFRSSFIRAQRIPGEIEGSHSALSKIIGKCWKALPREEREVWDAKAIVALQEHRRKYPDWRFKPAANALAKVKDGPRKRSNRKGRGQSEKEERSREKRCAKIADLLVAGKTGVDLASAVEQYDCEVGRGRKLKDEGANASVPQVQGDIHDGVTVNTNVKVQPAVAPHLPSTTPLAIFTECVDVKPSTPRSAVDGRFKVPLTAMFKRSSSAPAPRARTPAEQQLVAGPRRDSFSAAPPSYPRATSFDISGVMQGNIQGTGFDGDASREGAGHASADSVVSFRPFNLGVPALPLILPRGVVGGIGVNDQVGVDAYNFAASAFSSPPLPAFEPDGDALSSRASSPIATPMMFSWCQDPDVGSPTSISDMMGEACPSAPSPSSYSSLEGWAGSPLPKQASPISSPLVKVYNYVDEPGSPSVMERAFDAASRAIYGEYWNDPGTAAGTAGTAQAPYAWGPEQAFSSSYVFPVHCRQDDY